MKSENPNKIFKNKLLTERSNKKYDEASKLDPNDPSVGKLRDFVRNLLDKNMVRASPDDIEWIVRRVCKGLEEKGVDLKTAMESDDISINVEFKI